MRWVGIGALSNLADVLTAHPGLVDRLHVTQMGGAINYRHPDRAEHNFRLDPTAALTAVARVRDLRLVISDVTWTDRIAVDHGHEVYRLVAGSSAPWAGLLRAHYDQWFAYRESNKLHDPLTLSAAMGLGFCEVRAGTVADGARCADGSRPGRAQRPVGRRCRL